MSTAVRAPCDEGVMRAAPPSPHAAAWSPADGRWVLAATVLGSSMAFIDGTVVNVALPVLQRELGAAVGAVQWVVSAYALFLAALLLLGGALGDRYGRRRVFMAGVALFTCASAACGLSPSLALLVAARAVQGVGAALLVPGSLAILSATFPPAERGRAIGTWSAFGSITAGLGPVLGGWLVQHLSWRWAFFLNLPVGAAVLLICAAKVPETRDPAARRLDPAGAALVTLALAALTFGLVRASARGFGEGMVVALLGGGAALLAAFAAVERRQASPMLPPDLFRSRTFTGANLLTLLLYGALGSVMFLVPFDLIQAQGYSPTAAGGVFVPFTVLMFALSRTFGALADRRGPRLPLTVGPLVAAAGIALFAAPGLGGSYWTTFFPAVCVMGLGMSISVAPLTTAVMGAVGPEHAGVASGVNNAVSRAAALLSVALASLGIAWAFSASLAPRLAALPLPPAAREALWSERGLLAAARPPAGLPAEVQRSVERALDLAFVDAFRTVSLLAAGLAALGGAAAFFLIRPDPAGQTNDGSER